MATVGTTPVHCTCSNAWCVLLKTAIHCTTQHAERGSAAVDASCSGCCACRGVIETDAVIMWNVTARLHGSAVDDLAGRDDRLEDQATLGALVERDRVQLALDLHRTDVFSGRVNCLMPKASNTAHHHA